MMRSVVLDASALGDFVLDAQGHRGVEEVLGREGYEVVVPHLCDIEVASGLRSMMARGVLDARRGAEALEFYRSLPLQRIGHLTLLSRILALRDNFSAYDATYVALAQAAGAELHTADQRLARAVRQHTDLEVVEV